MSSLGFFDLEDIFLEDVSSGRSLAARLLETSVARVVSMIYGNSRPAGHGSVLAFSSQMTMDTKSQGTTEVRTTQYMLPTRIGARGDSVRKIVYDPVRPAAEVCSYSVQVTSSTAADVLRKTFASYQMRKQGQGGAWTSASSAEQLSAWDSLVSIVRFGAKRDVSFSYCWTLAWSNLLTRILHDAAWTETRLRSLGANIIWGGPKSHALNAVLAEADLLGSESAIFLEVLDSEMDLVPALCILLSEGCILQLFVNANADGDAGQPVRRAGVDAGVFEASVDAGARAGSEWVLSASQFRGSRVM
eukprot:4219562-Amphidinium_carterae.1